MLTLEECAFVKVPVIVIPVSHSPKLLAETEKDIVAGLEEALLPPPPPPPPARATAPTTAKTPACEPIKPVLSKVFGVTNVLNIKGSKEL